MVRTLPTGRNALDLPDVALIPCIPNESREEYGRGEFHPTSSKKGMVRTLLTSRDTGCRADTLHP